jgi:hypothetical protein
VRHEIESVPERVRKRKRERGQAMVELVLISPFLFLLVGGIIQFALALNYWLDMQRLANQGARWAVVARYPLPDGSMCVSSGCDPALQEAIALQAQSEGLNPVVSICFPNWNQPNGDAVGEPVRVNLETDFSFVPILGIGTVTLGADAEMRIEQPRGTVYDATGPC